jgi:arsenite methyltransferase
MLFLPRTRLAHNSAYSRTDRLEVMPEPIIDPKAVREEVSKVYSRVASDPDADFHFHRGPAYAVEFLGYDPTELATLPSECVASFAGIANPHAIAPILPGETVLDIGCGAGTDLLLAARKVGPNGRTIGIDMTEAMRDRALTSAATAGLRNVAAHCADATALPLPDASVDVVISNGVLNLVPEKDKAFAEIWRVLRPGGRLQLGDIVLDSPISREARADVGLWTD